MLLQLGNDTYTTSYKENAGGKNVTFNEKISFQKHMSDTILKVKVFDKNLLSDLMFGDCSVDLRQQTIKTVNEITVLSEISTKKTEQEKLSAATGKEEDKAAAEKASVAKADTKKAVADAKVVILANNTQCLRVKSKARNVTPM